MRRISVRSRPKPPDRDHRIGPPRFGRVIFGRRRGIGRLSNWWPHGGRRTAGPDIPPDLLEQAGQIFADVETDLQRSRPRHVDIARPERIIPAGAHSGSSFRCSAS